MIAGLLSSFPKDYNPNPQQVKLLKNIDQAFTDGHKFVVCNAPTGSGKSFISKTIGNVADQCTEEFRDIVINYLAFKRAHGGSYTHEGECYDEKAFGCTALTITKALQDQYKDLFEDIEALKGKSNYMCAVDDTFNVEVAPCMLIHKLRDECWSKGVCPYYEQRNKALVSTFNTLNYNMFFSLPTHLKKRQYLICDEAAELEGQLVKEFSCNVNFEFLKKMEIHIRPIYTKGDNIIKWINVLVLELKEKMDWLQDAITGAKGKKYLLEKKSELIGLSNLHSKLSLIIDSWQDSEYIYDKDAKGITFMPLKVDKLSNHLFKYADKVILMSATIIDPSNFCKNLGIEEFKYVEAESSFNPDNAPIFCNTKVKLNYYNMDKNLPKIAKQVEEICNFHKDEKGIIHTQNNNITSYMAGKLLGERYLIREPGVRNEDILDQHMASDEPTVLISPSLSHGVDLKDDLARFQIIIKAPFLPTRDKRIEKMMKGDFVWYENKMLCSLIQACGRGVRSQKDHCTTYILDAAVVESVIKNKYKLPKYFLDRFC